MDNTERSDNVYVNTEEVENSNFIENSGEAMAPSSSLPPLRKIPLNNTSGHESHGCTSKRFKIVYPKETSEKFIPDKDVKEAILLKLPKS